MNAWLVAALVLAVAGLTPCLARVLHGPPEHRLVGVALGGTLATVVFLLLSQGLTRSSYGDLALVLAVLAPAGTLVFSRLLAGERPDGSGSPDGPEDPDDAQHPDKDTPPRRRQPT